MESFEEFKEHGFTVKLYEDETESPREWCNVGVIAYKHRNYVLGEETIGDPVEWLAEKLGIEDVHAHAARNGHGYPYCDQYKELLEARFLDDPRYVALPVYIYDHSGVTINTTGFSCGWDSGQVGYVYATADSVRESFMVKRVTAKVRERALDTLRSEIEVFDSYIRGEVYGFTVETPDGDVLDSCGGYIGDPDESGVKDEALACIPSYNEIREQGDLASCEFFGEFIRKVFRYKLHGITAYYDFELIENTTTRECDYNVLAE